MLIKIYSTDHGYQKTCEDIVRMFYPQAIFTSAGDYDMRIKIKYEYRQDINGLLAEGKILSAGKTVSCMKLQETAVNVGSPENQAKRLANLLLFRMLKQTEDLFDRSRRNSNRHYPWGILTGVRPNKIVHRLLDAGWQNEDIRYYLQNSYAIEEDKINLLLATANRQRPFMSLQQHNIPDISVYVGIPFCPTKCAYCSFSGYPIKIWASRTDDYIAALISEIEIVGKYLQENDIKIENLYIGGGTPTSITDKQLDLLLTNIHSKLDLTHLLEFTVEAGRPDTINKKNLRILKDHGADRLSINPQSMERATLQLIGRQHTPEDIIKAYDLARKFDFGCINMDMILGLPGEKVSTVEKTLKQLLDLEPENLTVHTLALKRASVINQNREEYNLPDAEIVSAMASLSSQMISGRAMYPYYLYRQKQMIGNLENIGYCRPGKESLYNIQIIEERQSIIGVGAGAGSKFVNPADWSLESFYNTKDPGDYINRVDTLTRQKTDKIENLLQLR